MNSCPQELLEGYPIDKVPLAVHVPMNPESAVPEGAFAGVPRLRHVSVESGIRLIGPEACHSCQLRIVKLPSTVVSISDNAFRSCKLLNIFFHEYGRRVGMVPRSSLKEGKNSQMVEKRTRTTKPTQNQTNHSPQAESPPSCSLSSVLGETSETKTNDYQWA